jgi:hypothetical protein
LVSVLEAISSPGREKSAPEGARGGRTHRQLSRKSSAHGKF